MFIAAISVGGPVATQLLKMPSLVGKIFTGILLGPNLGSPLAVAHFPKGASKAVAKGEALAEAEEWRNQRHQKTDDNDGNTAEEEDAASTLGTDVEDLKKARDAVAVTLPTQARAPPRQTARRTSATQVSRPGRAPVGCYGNAPSSAQA